MPSFICIRGLAVYVYLYKAKSSARTRMHNIEQRQIQININMLVILMTVFLGVYASHNCENNNSAMDEMTFNDCKEELMGILHLLCHSVSSSDQDTGGRNGRQTRENMTRDLVCQCCYEQCDLFTLTKFCDLIN